MPKRQKRMRLPSDLPRERVHNTLKRLGFVIREGDKHTGFVDPKSPDRIVTIPRHTRIKRRLLKAELKKVGISERRFMREY